MKKYQVFSKEFKLESVRLLEEGRKPAADIASEIGDLKISIRNNKLKYIPLPD